MAYSKELLDHYENPKNVGSMDKESEQVGTGLVGAPACGDVMKLQIKVKRLDVARQLRRVRLLLNGLKVKISMKLTQLKIRR